MAQENPTEEQVIVSTRTSNGHPRPGPKFDVILPGAIIEIFSERDNVKAALTDENGGPLQGLEKYDSINDVASTFGANQKQVTKTEIVHPEGDKYEVTVQRNVTMKNASVLGIDITHSGADGEVKGEYKISSDGKMKNTVSGKTFNPCISN